MDIFNQVMQFMIDHNLKPSSDLNKIYRNSKLKEELDLPNFDELHDKINMTIEVYDQLKAQ